MPNTIAIIGSGGVGREIAATLKHDSFKQKYKLIGFVDDGQPTGTKINGFPVLGNLDWLCNNSENIQKIIIAIGNPLIRAEIIKKIASFNFEYPTIIHPSAEIHDLEYCTIGKGCYIASHNVITTNVTLEDFCFINTNCSLQHDTTTEKNCTLMPGVRITGGAQIGEGTFVSGNTLLPEKINVPSFSRL